MTPATPDVTLSSRSSAEDSTPLRNLAILMVLMLALLAWLQYRLWFGEGGQRRRIVASRRFSAVSIGSLMPPLQPA